MKPEEDQHAYDHDMNCSEVVQKVYAFLDGELSLEEIAVYKDHLHACLPCKAYVKFEEKLVKIIQEKGSDPAAKVPDALVSKIKIALERAQAAASD